MCWPTGHHGSLVLRQALVDNACECLAQPVGHSIPSIALLAVQEPRYKKVSCQEWQSSMSYVFTHTHTHTRMRRYMHTYTKTPMHACKHAHPSTTTEGAVCLNSLIAGFSNRSLQKALLGIAGITYLSAD